MITESDENDFLFDMIDTVKAWMERDDLDIGDLETEFENILEGYRTI